MKEVTNGGREGGSGVVGEEGSLCDVLEGSGEGDEGKGEGSECWVAEA